MYELIVPSIMKMLSVMTSRNCLKALESRGTYRIGDQSP